MSTHSEERRAAELTARDAQFAAAAPDATVAAAIAQAGLHLPAVIDAVLEGYSERPALGQRAYELAEDPQTGRTSARLLPWFNTITYGEVAQRVDELSRALTERRTALGDRVCALGFSTVDYATIELAVNMCGAVSVPLQFSASQAQLLPIVVEAEPSVFAASVDYLSDAVEVILAAAEAGHTPGALVVFDYRGELDDDRDALQNARERLSDINLTIETLDEVRAHGAKAPAAQPIPKGEDRLAALIYTSGSTGAPKGAMYPQSNVAKMWDRSVEAWMPPTAASITLNFMPMSHVAGRALLFGTLGNGGICYFAASNDQSTLLEDLRLVRPTELFFVPRIWQMLFSEYRSEIDRQEAAGVGRETAEAQVHNEFRDEQLGGRFVISVTGSAPISSDLAKWAEALLEMPLQDGYGSTEAGIVLLDGVPRRPPVTDYKLVDVPDLGYFATDRPYARGELLVKADTAFPGYYKRPETTAGVFDEGGYYRTGDVFAEVAPDRLVYVDRRNNVLKLAQGEFVTLAKLEAEFGNSPLVRQIFVYGNSAQPYLLAVVVPTDETVSKSAIAESLQSVARQAGLQSYEVPRDFLVETTPFSTENGLLTGIRKLAWPKLKAHYGQRLEQLYSDVAQGQADELAVLRRDGAKGPVLATVSRAAAALLGAATSELTPDAHFTDLGGDSLSALTFGNLLREIFEVDVPVGVIVSPANDLAAIAAYIQAQRQGSKRPSFAAVHGRDARQVQAGDLTLDKFVDAGTLAAAPTLPTAPSEVRTVLLTGATGFLGRYLALEWLQRMDVVDGTVIALVRAKSDADARARLDATFDSGDQMLLAHYQRLAADHLEVIAGDKGEANLGLDQSTWQRLADTVDLIIDPAALVNHVLPYSELFGPNALGTAELIKIALTTTIKPYTYVSTIGVGDQITPAAFIEDADIRQISATRAINDGYANGYGTSKWAGEVLLREANDLCGLPVAVFRCDMILADTSYAGQLNLPDMFTRLLLSLVATGIAPASFYELDTAGQRQRAHYDGLPVEFIAEAISSLGAQVVEGFATYHVMNPYHDGIGLDTYVDWLIEAGYSLQRIGDYDSWLTRFESTLRGLPERQRQYSLLPLLHNYQKPQTPINSSMAPTDRFRAAVQHAKIGPDKDIPHITQPIITKYITDLQLLKLL